MFLLICITGQLLFKYYQYIGQLSIKIGLIMERITGIFNSDNFVIIIKIKFTKVL
jgi:hypothetical protein